MPIFACLLLAAIQGQTVPAVTTPVPQVPIAPSADAEQMKLGRDALSRMSLPVRINDRGPFAFTIDTASDRSVVSDTLASQLALPASDGVFVVGIDGRHPVPSALVETLQLGRREHHSMVAPVLSGPALEAQGLIGLDALAGETVLLDFEHDRISIARSEREAMMHDPDVIVVTARSRFGQLILTDARVGKTRVTAIIDTGAEDTIGNLALRRFLGREGPLVDRGNRVIGVAGGELPAEPAEVRNIRLGGIEIGAMPIIFADVETFRHFKIDDKPALLLGMDVLRQFRRVAIDFRRRSIRFQLGRVVTPTLRADGMRHWEETRLPGTPWRFED